MRKLILLTAMLCACSGKSPTTSDGGPTDGGATDAGVDAGSCDGACPQSLIQHVVVIIQENHSFDSYFGNYCTAAAGSNPTCTSGPGCCEAAPATDPSGSAPVVLDDTQNASTSPNHEQDCELAEMNDGGMDHFVSGGGNGCSARANFAVANAATLSTGYWAWATQGALADHWFQSLAGASASNDMYLARAGYVFTDNSFETHSKGSTCANIAGIAQQTYSDATIGDLLSDAGVTWAFYAEGYQQAVATDPACEPIPPDCPARLPLYPCLYDPTDVPFEFYSQWQDDPVHMRDFSQLAVDLVAGTFPSVVYVKGLGYHTEHPGAGTTITAGEQFVQSVLDLVSNSSYAQSTLVIITPDESGGYFDHVSPPRPNTADGQPYGPRIFTIAYGPFARAGGIAHGQLEHASIVKFIEWNWLRADGQLGLRDTTAHNIGELLDASKTGVTVPQ
ncbi:MAG: hypothetical protein JST54_09820 [Deltaproteobacteria bacterium]|nr:hypothetical protein [Deltaproteobacteria bacterium]